MPDPVAWKAVEKGWHVFDREGEQVGTVFEIAGDTEHDIFDGFGIKTTRFGRVKYVPAEIVASIAESCELLAPPIRVTGADVPTPFSPPLERHTLPDTQRIAAAVRRVVKGGQASMAATA